MPSPRRKRARSKRPGNRLIVQFTHAEDPSAEQTAVVHELVKKFAPTARVTGEMPGALKVDIRPESEEAFRREVQALPDWDVASEGTAEIPRSPAVEDLEDDEEAP